MNSMPKTIGGALGAGITIILSAAAGLDWSKIIGSLLPF